MSPLVALEHQLLIWMLCALRPGAAFAALPVLSGTHVPVILRLIIGFALGAPALATASQIADVSRLLSFDGMGLIVSEILLGLALGFTVRIAMASAVLGGELVGNAMGLGFASMNDPLSAHSTTAVSLLFANLANFLFFSSGAYLIFAAMIARSFEALPVGQAVLTPQIGHDMAAFGSVIFSAGLLIAAPVGFTVILVQIVMAVMSRATPSLNLISVGMPVALMAGLVFLPMAVPALADATMEAINLGLRQAHFTGLR
jgi:flagellar biosynthetic protein FliR